MGDIRAGLDEVKLDVALFGDVKFYVSGEADPKILSLLQKGSAERSNYFSDFVTHLIAGYEALESDICEAKDLYEIPAVTQEWVLQSAKCKRLLPTKYFSAEENQLFSNVRACISQVSQADSKSLWAMISLQGGKCQLRLDRYCTHLVVGKASGAKYEAAIRHNIKIITPDWVTDCCKEKSLIDEVEYHPRFLIYPSPNSSTALITGFMDEDGDNNATQEEQDRTKAMLEQLKQRMPWNQPNTAVSTVQGYSATMSSPVIQTPSSNIVTNSQSVQLPVQASIQPQTSQSQQQQTQFTRSMPQTSLPAYSSSITSVTNQNVINQTGWHNQQSPMDTSPVHMKPQVQQQEQIPQAPMNIPQQQIPQQINPQQMNQHPPQLQQLQTNFPQQMMNPQQSPQLTSPVLPMNQQPDISMSQHQQIAPPQQKPISTHQLQQQIPQQQSQLGPAPLQNINQQIINQQGMAQQQAIQQMGPPAQQQVVNPQQHIVQQQMAQLTPEQRQQLLLLQQQQHQQQKIQQISQQLQQSAPQGSQQFVIREGQLQPQSQQPNQVMNQNQQGFIVNREAWQQQQYHLQLQRQQQRPGGQWAQQPPQPPRQLIHLDAQTHQQLQQMDPQQRAQFIQRIQKSRNLILQRQMQNRQTQQQGPHTAVIRTPGTPSQWVQQPRPQTMNQVAQAAGQKPMHPGVQPPALTPINTPNQVIVQAGPGTVQSQPGQPGQSFQQAQLTPQQIAQLHLQKQQQVVRLQQLHLQREQQPQPQPVQQESPLTSLPANSQMPADQQLVCQTISNAKTKTALANMLTNRLQGAATEGSAAGQLRLMTAQHRAPPPPSQDPALLAAYQRRTLGNITNGAPPGTIKMQYVSTMPQQKAQFYGHNPNLKLPPDLFLLGCIFVIVEYETHYSASEVADWKQVIERYGGEVEPQYCARATHVLAISQKHPVVVQALREGKRCVNAHWLSDVVNKQQVLPPWHVLHFPIPFSVSEVPCPNHNVSFSGFEGEEREKLKAMLDALHVRYTTYFSRHNTLLICRRPDGPKYRRARDWQTPVVNVQWLIDLLCGSSLQQVDAPKYQQFSVSNPFRLDYSLVAHLMAAWKMPINITQESYDKVKQVGQGPNAMRKHKKPRLTGPMLNKEPHLLGLDEPIVVSNPDPPSPEKQPRILFSGTNPTQLAKRIRELGGVLAASWRDATHLVMQAPYRTVKFVCCLSKCKFIVNIQWLHDCSAKNTFVDEAPYILGDAEFEKNFNCNVEKALASPNRGSVLKGKTFYVTPSVVPSPVAFAEIIESAGGVMEKTRRSLVQIQEMNSEKINYIIITHYNDIHLLNDVARANIPVFNAEVVLNAICRQHFQLDTNNL